MCSERNRDCSAAGDGGTHWLSGCACQERRHALLEALAAAVKRMMDYGPPLNDEGEVIGSAMLVRVDAAYEVDRALEALATVKAVEEAL